MLDITQAPYNCNIPWTGNDASSPDYGPAIQQAIDDLAAGNWGLIDTYGDDGGRIIFPPYCLSVGQKLIMRDGISFEGHSKASSGLVMRQGFNPAHHFIDLGDSTSGHASFGGQIKNMHIKSRLGILGNSGSFMIFSNNVQDSGPIVDNCIVDGGSHFGGIKYITGVGGASLVEFKNLIVNSRKDAAALGNVPMVVRVAGSTMVKIDGFEPAVGWTEADPTLAIPGSYGLLCLGGSFELKRFHFEATETGVYFGDGFDNVSMADLSWFTGGGGLKNMVMIDNAPLWKDKIWMNYMMKKGVWPSSGGPGKIVYNLQPGASHVYNDIMDRTKF